jgi:hypothetical protein
MPKMCDIRLLNIFRDKPADLEPFLGTFAKLQRATIIVIMSVCLHGTAQLPPDGFS